jgi:hypothetical protein
MIPRIRRAWHGLAAEQRLAVWSAVALFVSMFLPWYQKDVDAVVDGRLVTRHDTLTAFGAFSFVEAAILLVAGGILALFFARGEGKRFHLPGGDGVVTMAAGIWVCVLVFIRQIDKPDAGGGDQVTATVGVHWGIFVTCLIGLAMASAGWRLRAAHIAEPGETPRRRPPRPRPPAHPADEAPTAATRPGPPLRRDDVGERGEAPTRVAPRTDRPTVDGGEQLSFDEQD